MAQKRTIYEVDGTQETDAEAVARGAPQPKVNKFSKPTDVSRRNSTTSRLWLPPKDSKPAAVVYQKPFQLVSFSYTPQRELVFDDRALRFWVEPPRNADLLYRYDKWIKRPEERGRLDGLLKALCREPCVDARKRAHAILWRGILCKCTVCKS